MPAASTAPSTVPIALQTVKAYFDAVKVENPDYELGTYLGMPTETASDNYLIVGGDSGNTPLSSYRSNWKSLPAPGYVDEDYSIVCALRVWSGETAPFDRFSDTFVLYQAFRQQMWADPGGDLLQANALTPSGSWGEVSAEVTYAGPDGGMGGYGVILTFDIPVINVRLQAFSD